MRPCSYERPKNLRKEHPRPYSRSRKRMTEVVRDCLQRKERDLNKKSARGP